MVSSYMRCQTESKNASKHIPNELKKSSDAPLVKDRASDNKDCLVKSPVVVEKKTVVPTIAKIEFVKAKQQEKIVRKPVKYAEIYRPKSCETESKNASKEIPNKLKESPYAPLVKDRVKDRVSDNKDCLVESLVVVEKKTVVPTNAKIEFVKAKQQEKPVRKPIKYAEMYMSQGLSGNQRNWNNLKLTAITIKGKGWYEGIIIQESKNASKEIPNKLKESPYAPLVKDRVSDNKDCLVESLVVVEKKTVVPTNAKIEFVKAKQQEKPVRKPIKYAEMYMSQGLSGNQRNWNNLKLTAITIKGKGWYEGIIIQVNTARPRPVNTDRPRLVNTIRLRPVNTARPNLAVVNAVKVSTQWEAHSQEDQPENKLGVFSSAKVLADTARRNVQTYTRRIAFSTGSGRVSTASRMISTAEESVSTGGASMLVSTAGMVDKGKGIIKESESDVIKTKRQQEQERLGLETDVRLQEQFDKEKRLQAEKKDKYSEVDQAKMLVDLINQRKIYFAKQKAKQATMRSINDFVSMESEDDKATPKLAEARSSKRDAEEELDQGRSKKQKIGESSEPRIKDVDELSQEEL
nr:ubiquitin hydrolase [Tanacetum cinerariifolium]